MKVSLKNIIIILTFLSFPLIYFLLTYVKENTISKELNAIFHGVQYGDSLVLSGQGTLVYEYIYPNNYINNEIMLNSMKGTPFIKDDSLIGNIPFSDTHEKSEINYSFHKEKVFFEKYNFNEGRIFPLRKLAFNGEKTTTIKYERNERELLYARGTIDNDGYKFLDKYDPRMFSMTLMGKPVGYFLDLAISGKNNTVSIIGEEYISDYLCTIIKLSVKDSKIDMVTEFTFWISPSCMYRPLKVEMKQPMENPVDHIIANVKYRKYSDNIWFLKQIIWNKFAQGTYIIHTVLTLNDDWILNTSLPDSLFEISFPKGLKVSDKRTGKSYINE